MKGFEPDHSIHMWWNAKTTRPNQNPRKEYKNRSAGRESESDEEDANDSGTSVLNDWDEFTATM